MSLRDDIERIYYALDTLNAKIDAITKACNDRFLDYNRIMLSQSTFSSILSQNIQQLQCAAAAAATSNAIAQMAMNLEAVQVAKEVAKEDAKKCVCFKDPKAAPGCSYCESSASTENK
jgi:hypothetical protein